VCEYCGCQAIASIAALTAEHDVVVNLIGTANAAVRAGDLSVAARQVGRILEVLEPHTAVEEQGLFPALAGDFPDHVGQLTGQHRTIESALVEAISPPEGRPSADVEARLVRALYLLREHILAEQDGVFPAALAALGPDEWAAVEAVRSRVGSLVRLGLPGGEVAGTAEGDAVREPSAR
jgi:hemerythrin-like domain-containing protein